MNLTKRISPNKNIGRSGCKPDMITCHSTEGSFDGAVSWLCNPTSQASAHFVVARDGRITQLVEITDTAWCNGTNNTVGDSKNNAHSTLAAVRDRKANANLYTVSIEHEGRSAETGGALTEAQLAATVELIKHIRSEVKGIYGNDIPVDKNHIVGHCHITPKWKPGCPGAKYPYDEIIKRLSGPAASGVKLKIGDALVTVPAENNDGQWWVKTSDGLRLTMREVLNLICFDVGWDAGTETIIATPKK